MTNVSHEFSLPRRRGVVSQVALTVFVGIPMTMGLLVALVCYCSFLFGKYVLMSRSAFPEGFEAIQEQSFSDSLASMAQIHGPTVKPTVANQESVAKQEVDVPTDVGTPR